MRRRVEGHEDVRASLATTFRGRFRDYVVRIGGFDPDTLTDAEKDALARRGNLYDGRADALDRGEPVRVANWELPRGVLPNVRGILGPAYPYWYVVEPDGTVRPATDTDHEAPGQRAAPNAPTPTEGDTT